MDDDRDTRDMYAMFLELSGFRVLTTGDANSAFDQALAHDPRVIVTDYQLRGGPTGVELCHRLKAHERTANIPTLLVTGSTRRADAEAALGAGCASVRLKPYLPDELLADIRTLMAQAAPGA